MHSAEEKGKWEAVLSFGQSCKDGLLDREFMKEYAAKVSAKMRFARKKSRSDERFGELLEELHDELGIGNEEPGTGDEPGASSGDEPGIGSTEPGISGDEPGITAPSPASEKATVMLDSSASMKGNRLDEGKSVLEQIMPRLERTPSTVHLIGRCDPAPGFLEKLFFGARATTRSRQIFSETDVFTFDEVRREWTADANRTFLWEYIFDTIMANPGSDQEVIIITDGKDNHSKGPFKGPKGFNHMMMQLRLEGIPLPRIIVYFITDDLGVLEADYRDLAIASGGDFFVSSAPGDNEAFVRHCLMEHSQRLLKASAQMQLYAKTTPEEEKFSWFALPAVSKSSKSTTVSRRAWGPACKGLRGAWMCGRQVR